MSDRRACRLDLAACLLLGLGGMLALAVFSHDPLDLTRRRYPPAAEVKNLLGYPGAWLALHLMRSLGLAVYLLLASWFVFVLLLFVRRRWLRWSVRLAGWLLLVPCGAVLAHCWLSATVSPSLVGPGGSLGTWLWGWLGGQLPGRYGDLLLGASTALGLGLALNFLWKPLAEHTWALGRRHLAFLRRLLCRLFRRQKKEEETTILITQAGTEGAEPAEDDDFAEQDSDPRAAPIPIRHHDQGGFIAEQALPGPRLRRPGKEYKRGKSPFETFELPPLRLLSESPPFDYQQQEELLRNKASLLEKTFADFGINVRVVGINTGPVITQFEVALETGLRVHKVTCLSDDVALNLKVPSVRMVAPIPGKNAVGIEIPNEMRADVRLKEVILAAGKKVEQCKLPLFVGKDSQGRPLLCDLAEMPHLLIAGRTGTGKSVCMNAIILSILMTRRPDEVRMVMVDPKGGVELNEYGRIPHLMHPIVTDFKKAECILAWAVDKMEERYELLSRARVRNIAAYNALDTDELMRRMNPESEEEREQIPEKMPYIIIFIDEMADLMLVMKKEVEGHIIRLAQKSRAAGIHLVVATQKPTVDVITGLIKSNLPARICFQVATKSDSRVVLDEMGADKLLGRGDMLFLPPGTSHLVRAQGAYASDKEICDVVGFLEVDNPCYAPELLQLSTTGGRGTGALMEKLRDRDPLYESAIEVILREGRGSVSLLQRALGIGYGRAARLIDFMAEDGIVGAYNGSNAREVLYTPQQWTDLQSGEDI
jgi:S-DNA-T family DNA segregation ATPase FtsK/SpoIIIE